MAFRSQLDDFAALYERTYPALYRTVLVICGDAPMAADVTQDAYVQAYRQRASFRGEVPVDAWLHRIAVNAALSGLRRRKVRWTEPLDVVRDDRPGRTVDAAVAIDLERALEHLEPRARAAVVLRYYHDTDYATIAAILGTTAGNVGSMLTRSLERLRRDLGEASPTVGSLTTAPKEAGRGR